MSKWKVSDQFKRRFFEEHGIDFDLVRQDPSCLVLRLFDLPKMSYASLRDSKRDLRFSKLPFEGPYRSYITLGDMSYNL